MEQELTFFEASWLFFSLPLDRQHHEEDLTHIPYNDMEGEKEPEMGFVGGESSWDRCLQDTVGEVQFIVYDLSRKRIIVTEVDACLMLPRWFSQNTCCRDITQMKQAAVDLFGAQCVFTVLRCIWMDERECERNNCLYTLKRSIVVLECQHGMRLLDQDVLWASVIDWSVSHSEEDARCAIKEELEYVKNDILPTFRVPWAQFGWYMKTVKWICEQLKQHCFVVTEPIGQLRVSPWGTVLRTQAESKRFYLKASPCFCNEAAINNILSNVAPLHVQKPLVVDTQANVYIASDHGDSIDISKLSDVDEVQMFIDLARLQKANISKLNELREAGVPIFETVWLAEHLDQLLDSTELSFMKEDEVLLKLRSKKEKIRKTLLELESLTEGLPMTVVHGDISSENVYPVNSNCRRFGFFDWDCAFIGLPLFDVLKLKANKSSQEAYLREWSVFHNDKVDCMNKLTTALSVAHKVSYIVVAFRAIYELSHMEKTSRAIHRFHVRLILEIASLML